MGQGNGTGRMKASDLGFKSDSENFIDPSAKQNYGNEPRALKRSFTVVIVSPYNPSYLEIKLTYIYMNTHTFNASRIISLSLSGTQTHAGTNTWAKSLVVG